MGAMWAVPLWWCCGENAGRVERGRRFVGFCGVRTFRVCIGAVWCGPVVPGGKGVRECGVSAAGYCAWVCAAGQSIWVVGIRATRSWG